MKRWYSFIESYSPKIIYLDIWIKLPLDTESRS